MESENNIAELRRAVVNDPRNAELRYLLGAEMAQHSDYDSAVMEMSAAIAFNPLLHTARFQLGLLHLTMGRPDHALAVFAPLENLDDSSALKYFKRGMDALVHDDLVKSAANLRAGIELNRENEALNSDMKILLERVSLRNNRSSPADDAMRVKKETSNEEIVRTDFSLYHGSRN